MNPLKSARSPLVTPLTVSCRTVPRFRLDWKITVALSPNASVEPWSVSAVPAGTGTVEDGDGDEADEAEVLGLWSPDEPVFSSGPPLHPASPRAALTATATRAAAGFCRGRRTRTLCPWVAFGSAAPAKPPSASRGAGGLPPGSTPDRRSAL